MFQFDSPNYTQTPNQFFDRLLAEIDSMAELKVTLAAIRFTFGFHRLEAEMSLSFMERATGLSRPMVIQGVRRAVERGTIVRNRATHRIRMNVRVGSLDALLATGKESLLASGNESLPKVVANLSPRNKKQFSLHRERKGIRRPTISGRLAGVARKDKEQ